MTGLPGFNYDEFNRVAAQLREMGFDVANPAESDAGSTDKPWDFYMRRSLAMLAECDTVCLLDGWKQSKDACTEIVMAQALGMSFYEYSSGQSINLQVEVDIKH